MYLKINSSADNFKEVDLNDQDNYDDQDSTTADFTGNFYFCFHEVKKRNIIITIAQ